MRSSGLPLGNGFLAAVLALFSLASPPQLHSAGPSPVITSIQLKQGGLTISADIPSGYGHAVLEASAAVGHITREALVAGRLTRAPGIITFQLPGLAATTFLRVRLGTEDTLPAAAHSGAPYFSFEESSGGFGPLSHDEKIGHVMNRLAYGPSFEDLTAIRAQGLAAYLDQQFSPESIDESSNTALASREADLFTIHRPALDTKLVAVGENWRYFKGSQAPPADWRSLTFDDASWLSGPSGFGYGDDDDATVLEDMRQTATNPGYIAVFLRKTFNLADLSDIDALILRIDFDDGFAAYLNGTEVARANVAGSPPAFNAPASSDHEAGDPVEYDLTARKSLLRAGANVLAIEARNANLTSSDLSLIPELTSRKYLPVPPQKRIKNLEALQQLVHLRGIYSKRQLQAVLAEFWENHFTTDYDKVAEYFANLRNSDAQPAMSETQAAAEAAQAEFLEYQFFYDNALGNFGDLLLFSATSPPQLIYLDNVLNVRGAANENYSREILELFGFGVDNRYTQEDIEQLARCFTGWTVRKVWPEEKKSFPDSARNPPTDPSVQFEDTILLNTGPGWKYFKGTQEPSPAPGGTPSTAWTEPAFNDASWLPAATGIGYGDGDDATVVSDMRNRYFSLFLRREFTLASPASAENLLLTVDYDDGFVAYLNGTEVARSSTMRGAGTPPPFNSAARGNREAGEGGEAFSLKPFLHLLKPAPEKNILAIQVHNVTLDSSDLSLIPRLIDRRPLPGSIENGDFNGLWTFRFNPSQHDTAAKTLFAGTPHEMKIPAGRTGTEGLRDAIDAIDSFVKHPSVSEFICVKLINKFVSDEINLRSFKDGTAPEDLKRLMDDAIRAWHSTTPAGNIKTVLRAILNPAAQDGYFWSRPAYRAKVKTPVEFINSTVRALAANVSGTALAANNDQLGMHLFSRDDPDGWSEAGVDWIDTGTMLSRIQFAQTLTGDRITGVRWDAAAWANARNFTSAAAIVDYFNQILFQGKMAASNRELLIQFATTNDAGSPLPLNPSRADFGPRVRELVGLILSMPQWHYQ